jgi:hypothetical protein
LYQYLFSGHTSDDSDKIPVQDCTILLYSRPHAVQVYICPWCDRVFRSETERIGHLLTGHGVEVREEEGEGEEGGASTPHPFILPRSHTEEEQDQLGEYLTVRDEISRVEFKS